tara:strand:+ start:1179 stop:1589 length:411 start_codon:yes stop_codon:yes gene_type:complete
MKLLIKRFSHEENQTLGYAIVFNENNGVQYTFSTLELAWKDNAKRMSCIPVGTYVVKKRWSEKYKDHFIVQDVPNRSYILLHSGNYNRHTLGCILCGKEHLDINGDGERDITSSKATMKKLNEVLSEQFEMVIENS